MVVIAVLLSDERRPAIGVSSWTRFLAHMMNPHAKSHSLTLFQNDLSAFSKPGRACVRVAKCGKQVFIIGIKARGPQIVCRCGRRVGNRSPERRSTGILHPVQYIAMLLDQLAKNQSIQ